MPASRRNRFLNSILLHDYWSIHFGVVLTTAPTIFNLIKISLPLLKPNWSDFIPVARKIISVWMASAPYNGNACTSGRSQTPKNRRYCAGSGGFPYCLRQEK
jgi:hypothetical protein